MGKRKWLIAQITALALALAVNFLTELIFPLIDPQAHMYLRSLLIALFALIAIVSQVMNDRAEGRNPRNPADVDTLCWHEAVEIVSLSMVSILTLCAELLNKNSFEYQLWTITAVTGLVSFVNVWPTDRKAQYRQMEGWILGTLEEQGSVSTEEVLNHFARTGQSVNQRVSPRATPKGREYLMLIRWFR